ncbi:MAG: phasin family protein [Betaproteobacteria bacterium]|nr:phasin family protein [Betaproteobacteria bacterium]
MANPNEQLAAWQKAALESTLTYAQASIASAEQLLKLNLDAARNSLEQAGKNTRELLSISDPQELLQLRSKIAQANMQQTASYAQNIYEIVSQTQALLTKLNEEQFSRLNQEAAAGAEQLSKGTPGAEAASATVKSTLAATNAMMDNLNRATKQFAELSEASINAATAGMFNTGGKK